MWNIAALVDFDRGISPQVIAAVENWLARSGGPPEVRRGEPVRGSGYPEAVFFRNRICAHDPGCKPRPFPGPTWSQAFTVSDCHLENAEDFSGRPTDSRMWDAAEHDTVVNPVIDRLRASGLRELRGAFAVLSYNHRLRSCLAARDPLGLRALAWGCSGSRTVVASTIAGVLAGLDSPPPVDSNVLRDFVYLRSVPERRRSVHQGIEWLPPGHCLAISPEGVALTRTCELAEGAPFSGTFDEACQQFRELLTQSVLNCLPARGNVGFRLSGGFDSSALAGIAGLAVRESKTQAALRAYSVVFSTFSRADERIYLREVLSRLPEFRASEIDGDQLTWSLDSLNGADGFLFDEPAMTARTFLMPPLRQAVADGCSVICSGEWADQLAVRRPSWCPDLWLGLGAIDRIRFAPDFLRAPFRTLLAEVRMLAETFIRDRGTPLGRYGVARRVRLGFVSAPHPGNFLWRDQVSRAARIEQRFPYAAQSLVEFVMTLPAKFFVEPRCPKPLITVGLADLLPTSFKKRTQFGNVGLPVRRGMEENAAHLKREFFNRRTSTLLAHGIVSDGSLEKVGSLLAPHMKHRDFLRVDRWISAEVWLRRFATHWQS